MSQLFYHKLLGFSNMTDRVLIDWVLVELLRAAV